MKKSIVISVTTLLSLALIGCGNTQSKQESSTSSSTSKVSKTESHKENTSNINDKSSTASTASSNISSNNANTSSNEAQNASSTVSVTPEQVVQIYANNNAPGRTKFPISTLHAFTSDDKNFNIIIDSFNGSGYAEVDGDYLNVSTTTADYGKVQSSFKYNLRTHQYIY
jgi:hypothetical protein